MAKLTRVVLYLGLLSRLQVILARESLAPICFPNGTLTIANPLPSLYRKALAYNGNGTCQTSFQDDNTQVTIDNCQLSTQITIVLTEEASDSFSPVVVLGGRSHQGFYRITCQPVDAADLVADFVVNLGVTERPSAIATISAQENVEDDFAYCFVNGSLVVRNPDASLYMLGAAYCGSNKCDAIFIDNYKKLLIDSCCPESAVLVVFGQEVDIENGILGGRSQMATFLINCFFNLPETAVQQRQETTSTTTTETSAPTSPQVDAPIEDHVIRCFANGSMVIDNPNASLYTMGAAYSGRTRCNTSFTNRYEMLLVDKCNLESGILVIFGKPVDTDSGIVGGKSPMTTFKATCPDNYAKSPIQERLVATRNSYTSTTATYSEQTLFKVRSSLRAGSYSGLVTNAARLGEPLVWTLDVPVPRSVKPENCTAHTTTSSNHVTAKQLIIDGCSTDHELCLDFEKQNRELVENNKVYRHFTTLLVFNLSNSDHVTISCTVKICPVEDSPACDLQVCSAEKRSLSDDRIAERSSSFIRETVSLSFWVLKSSAKESSAWHFTVFVSAILLVRAATA